MRTVELRVLVVGLGASIVVSSGARAEGVLDGGGRQVSAGTVAHQGSLGGVTGISVATPTVAKQGFLAQLTEPVALQVSASPLTVDEGGTRQLEALVVLDDASVRVPSGPVAWNVLTGPLTGIDGGGLATAGVVYEDTEATVEGTGSGVTGTLDLTVLDTIADNFGSYAGDGVGDDWQVLYFGIGNAEAGPLLDPDRDGQDNRFEWVAGQDPTDALSFFGFTVGPVVGEPDRAQIDFGPLVSGRNYTVQSSTSFEPGSWQAVVPVSQTDDGTERAVVDATGGDEEKFYRVAIEKP